VACAGYQSRQPEINALREKIEGKDRVIATMRRVEEILRGDLEKMFEKNAALQAEVERLRKLYLSKAEGLDATEAAMKEMK
jgi:regulator of replication initiation timing